MARARSAPPILRWQGEGYRTAPARGAAGAGAGGRSRARPPRVRGGRRSGSRRCRPRRPRSRPSSPDRPRSGTRQTWRPPRKCCGRPGRRARRRRRRRRSGGWTAWSRRRPTGSCSRPSAPSSRSRASRYNPLVLVGGRRGGQDPPAARDRQRPRPSRRVRWPASARAEFTGELIEAIDRDAVAGLARALPPGHRVPARRRAPRSRDKDRTQDELFVLFNVLDRRRAGSSSFTSAVPLAELDRRRGAAPLAPRGRAGGRAAARPTPPCVERVLRARARGQARRGRPRARRRTSPPARPIRVRAAQALLQRVLAAAEAKGVAAERRPSRARCSRSRLRRRPRRSGRRPSGSSGVVGAGAGATRSREKMVWEWPEVGDRVIEEWR